MSHAAGRPQKNYFVQAMFFLCILFLYIPLGYIIFQAFLLDQENWSSGFTLKWVIKLWNSHTLWHPLTNSIKVGVLSATLSVILGTLGAVGLSRAKKNLPAAINTLILLPVLLPEVITALSLLLFFLVIKVPLGFFTIVIAHASFSASFVFFILVEQFKNLDPQMLEAALDLGATPHQAFWKVTFPNVLPGILGGWLLAFTLSFDDFLISNFTSGPGFTTLPLKIYSLMKIGLSPELNGLSLFLILTSTALVLLLFSREGSRKWVLRK